MSTFFRREHDGQCIGHGDVEVHDGGGTDGEAMGWVEGMDAAKQEGMAQSDYAKGKSLELQPVHDAIATLRRRRALPGSDRPRKRKSRFLAIRVTSSPAPVTEVA